VPPDGDAIAQAFSVELSGRNPYQHNPETNGIVWAAATARLRKYARRRSGTAVTPLIPVTLKP